MAFLVTRRVLLAAAFSVSSQLAVAIINWFTTAFLEPRLLPRLDFSNGIPDRCRTIVVPPMPAAPGASVTIVSDCANAETTVS